MGQLEESSGAATIYEASLAREREPGARRGRRLTTSSARKRRAEMVERFGKPSWRRQPITRAARGDGHPVDRISCTLSPASAGPVRGTIISPRLRELSRVSWRCRDWRGRLQLFGSALGSTAVLAWSLGVETGHWRMFSLGGN